MVYHIDRFLMVAIETDQLKDIVVGPRVHY